MWIESSTKSSDDTSCLACARRNEELSQSPYFREVFVDEEGPKCYVPRQYSGILQEYIRTPDGTRGKVGT